MPITVQYRPDFGVLGAAAQDIGYGKRKREEEAQARRDAEIAARIQLSQERLAEQQRQFDIQAQMNAARFGESQYRFDVGRADREAAAAAEMEQRKELLSMQHGFRMDEYDFRNEDRFSTMEGKLLSQGYEYTPAQRQQIEELDLKTNKIKLQEDLRPDQKEFLLRDLRLKRHAILPSRPKEPEPTGQDLFEKMAVRDPDGNLLGIMDPRGGFKEIKAQASKEEAGTDDGKLLEKTIKTYTSLRKQYDAAVANHEDTTAEILKNSLNLYEKKMDELQHKFLGVPGFTPADLGLRLPTDQPTAPPPPAPAPAPSVGISEATAEQPGLTAPPIDEPAVPPPPVPAPRAPGPIEKINESTLSLARDVKQKIEAGIMDPVEGQNLIWNHRRRLLKDLQRKADAAHDPDLWLATARAIGQLEEVQRGG